MSGVRGLLLELLSRQLPMDPDSPDFLLRDQGATTLLVANNSRGRAWIAGNFGWEQDRVAIEPADLDAVLARIAAAGLEMGR